LSVVDLRYRAVLAVLAGESVTNVAAQAGVSRQTLHKWLARYRDDGLAGLMDRPKRPPNESRRRRETTSAERQVSVAEANRVRVPRSPDQMS
jgi:transposase-like protein